MKVLVCDPISKHGVEFLKKTEGLTVEERLGLKGADLLAAVADADAIVVRSETKITREVIAAAKKLRAIGRAGVGVDNVDVDAASERGVIVMNTPGGNTISTAEHTFSMMMALARNIPQAHGSMHAGKWDRKSYQGVELHGKTLGLIGMGRIGTEVARRAIAFGMRVLAYDPYLALSRAKALQVEILEVEELVSRADFISIHTPMTDQTRGLINKAMFDRMKPGVRLLNCARGGLIVEADLAEAIKAGKVAGAALDVFETEPLPADSPLLALPQVVTTPHLGASTREAQESVGVEIAQAIADVLIGGIIRNAVNIPSLDAKTLAQLQPYLTFAEKLGKLLAQTGPRRAERLTVHYSGRVSELDTNPITRSVLVGFLRSAEGREVNFVNAPVIATSMGVRVEESRSTAPTDYPELITAEAQAGDAKESVSGTFYGSLNNPRIVRLNNVPVEAVPSGVLFILQNNDRPGVVGWVGTVMGKHKINIAQMTMGRDKPGGTALTILNLDSEPGEAALAEIKANKDVRGFKIAKL
ncbi:MAG: phosphoglycerate dehydrogenase [Verrucomicrobia bacterium]|nr:phosphoglycerate dehydrogenase [Verrucomicrobiota bacterium]